MVALACLFLASKVEERAVKVKDLVQVHFKLFREGTPSEQVSHADVERNHGY